MRGFRPSDGHDLPALVYVANATMILDLAVGLALHSERGPRLQVLGGTKGTEFTACVRIVGTGSRMQSVPQHNER